LVAGRAETSPAHEVRYLFDITVSHKLTSQL
jgi:hypothetical protein